MNATSFNTREPNNPKADHTFPGPLDQLHWTPYGYVRRGCGSEICYTPKRLNKGPLSLLAPRPLRCRRNVARTRRRCEGHLSVDTRTRRCRGPGVRDSPFLASGCEIYKISSDNVSTSCFREDTSATKREGTKLTYQTTAQIATHSPRRDPHLHSRNRT
jgi:hypothetical protein